MNVHGCQEQELTWVTRGSDVSGMGKGWVMVRLGGWLLPGHQGLISEPTHKLGIVVCT